MQVGGFYVTNMPAWIAWMKYTSFVFYGYNVLLKVEYSGRTMYDCGGLPLTHANNDPRCTVVPPGGLQHVLKLEVCPVYYYSCPKLI